MTKDIAEKENKKDSLEVFFPHNPDTSRLLVGMRRTDYSASRLSHAVEDADAKLLNLNVTSLDLAGAELVVALRVNHRNPERVVRSLERYGYSVICVDGPMPSDDTIRRRYEELMRLLAV